jgi:hypothetical protein
MFSGVFVLSVAGWHGINTMGAPFLLASLTLLGAAAMAAQVRTPRRSAIFGS